MLKDFKTFHTKIMDEYYAAVAESKKLHEAKSQKLREAELQKICEAALQKFWAMLNFQQKKLL